MWSKKSKQVVVSILISTLVFIGLSQFEIFVFDDSYDAFISNISSGQFTPFPMMDQHYLGVLVIRDLLKVIQQILPNINVFATSYIFLNVACLALFIYTVIRYMLGGKLNLGGTVLVLTVVLLSIESIVSITHTRFATVMCGLALYNLFDKSSKNYIFWNIVFVFGFLIRPESAVGAMLVLGFGILLFRPHIYRALKQWSIPLLSILVFVLSFSIHRSLTDRFEILIEPDIEYALSTQRIKPIEEFTTPEDKLRYKMAISGMFVDEDFTNLEFLNNLTSVQFEFNSSKFKESLVSIAEFYQYYLYFLVFYLLSILVVPSHLRFKLLAYYAFVFLLLSYLDYNIAVADRHFSSMQLVVILWPLKLILEKRPSWKVKLLIFLSFLAAIKTYDNTIKNQRMVAQEVGCLETAMREIESIHQDKNILVGVSSFHLLDRRYSFYKDTYDANNYLLYDAVNYSIVPRNMDYLSEQCGCNAHRAEEFLEWVHSSNTLTLMSTARRDVLNEYLDLKANLNLSFEKLEMNSLRKPECLENISIDDYELWSLQKK